MVADPNDPRWDDSETPVRVVHPPPVTRAPRHLPPLPDDAPEWYVHARMETGIKEMPGAAFHPRIMEYFKATTLGTSVQNDETAWCSAFACWCMERSGIASPHRANARSWLNWGEKLTTPRFGCIVVFWRGSPQSAQGHVGFYVSETASTVNVLGGNQGNQVCVAPYPKMRVLG